MKITSLITVRSASSRLPKKCFYKFGDRTVLDHVIERSSKNYLNPIVCTTESKEDNKIIDICNLHKIPYFRGPSSNKLLRWKLCCEKFGISSFHTIDADDPFFCPEEIKRSFSTLNKNNLDIVLPYKSSSSGGAMVGYSIKFSLLKKALIDLPEDTDTEMAWSYLNFDYTVKSKELEPPIKYEIKGRLTLDYWEDYIFLEALRLMLGLDSTRKNIWNILDTNKDLLKINSFRTFEWAKLQEAKLKKSDF